MKVKLIVSTIFLVFLVFTSFVYCQELDGLEMAIYFDASAVSMKALAAGTEEPSMADLAVNYKVSEDKLEDIMMRGVEMPLDSEEQAVAGELKQRLSSPDGAKVTPADIEIMRELGKKNQMNLGHVCSIFVRMNSKLL